MDQPQSKKIHANGIDIHYWDWGGDGPPMVMLHPSRGFGRIWDFLAQRLCDQYRVLCPDQRGHGDSDKPAGDHYAGEDFAADLDAFTRGLGLGRTILVGHSLGSRAGMIYAAEHHDRISHLIMVGGPHYVSVVPQSQKEQQRRDNRAQQQRSVSPVFTSSEEALESLRTPTSVYRQFSDEIRLHMVEYNMNHFADGSVQWKWDGEATLKTLSHIPDDLNPYIKRITCPILVPWGKRERDLTPERIPIVRPLFPTSRWVFMEDATYYMYLEAPDSLARVIRDFLEQ